MRKQELGPAQEKYAVIVERKMKSRENASLGVGVEVHQGVATHEQVEMRDGSVMDQIVTAKNDGASEVALEDQFTVEAFEEALLPFSAKRLAGVGGISTLASYRQRLFVDVR